MAGHILYNAKTIIPGGLPSRPDTNVRYDRRTIPTGLCILAQGCSTAATLGNETTKPQPHRGCVNKRAKTNHNLYHQIPGGKGEKRGQSNSYLWLSISTAGDGRATSDRLVSQKNAQDSQTGIRKYTKHYFWCREWDVVPVGGQWLADGGVTCRTRQRALPGSDHRGDFPRCGHCYWSGPTIRPGCPGRWK